ncbi:MAG: hypothetical protein Tsb0020_23670 [Haliangiales bacterium]
MPGGHILVVDDEVGIRDIVGQFLEQEGYEVDYSPNGVDALEKVRAEVPDLILLDLMMPGMNGHEFIAVLRNKLGLTHVPILVMTGIQGLAPRQAHDMGATDVIEKPFDIDVVLNKVALSMFRSGRHPIMEDGFYSDAAIEIPAELRGDDGADFGPNVGADVGSEAGVAAGGDVRSDLGSGAADRPRGGNGRADHVAVVLDPDRRAPSVHPNGVVLLVESDLALRRHLDILLGAHGYRVVAMGQVNDELPRLARVLEPQAILIEYGLPGLDGLSALRRLRADTELDQVACLLSSRDSALIERLRGDINGLAVALRVKPLADDEVIGFVTCPPATARRIAS